MSICVLCCCSFYKLNDVSMDEINHYLSQLVQTAMQQLVQSYCVDVAEVSCVLWYWQKISTYVHYVAEF